MRTIPGTADYAWAKAATFAAVALRFEATPGMAFASAVARAQAIRWRTAAAREEATRAVLDTSAR